MTADDLLRQLTEHDCDIRITARSISTDIWIDVTDDNGTLTHTGDTLLEALTRAVNARPIDVNPDP